MEPLYHIPHVYLKMILVVVYAHMIVLQEHDFSASYLGNGSVCTSSAKLRDIQSTPVISTGNFHSVAGKRRREPRSQVPAPLFHAFWKLSK